MKKEEIYSKILDIHPKTYYSWAKQNKPILKLLKYFEDEDLIEFISTSKISKMEDIQFFDKIKKIIIEENENKLINFIYAYGDDFMGVLNKKEDFENNNKYKLFFDEYYSSSTFCYYFDYLRLSKFQHIFDDLLRFKDEYDDFIYDFFCKFSKRI